MPTILIVYVYACYDLEKKSLISTITEDPASSSESDKHYEHVSFQYVIMSVKYIGYIVKQYQLTIKS